MILFHRDVIEGTKSTAQAFQSWDTCMANTPCKIIVIVLIVLGSLFVIWVITTIFQCLVMGATCIDACCCCCCRNKDKNNGYNEKYQQNPNMYPPPTYYNQRLAYQPQPAPSQAYFTSNNAAPTVNNNKGYEPVYSSYGRSTNDTYNYDDENPFNENSRGYRSYQ
ncbi:unnamed protein product [Candida verbasci]|uniref:Uncharacterized protein n=1 Tax=Candida verbasci TaxID=1227364 RepID=A0A9W4TXN3_9ASCO|nr:unnamed protein product [Candida verbasci]